MTVIGCYIFSLPCCYVTGSSFRVLTVGWVPGRSIPKSLFLGTGLSLE